MKHAAKTFLLALFSSRKHTTPRTWTSAPHLALHEWRAR
jgi:hypothetical protein